MTRVNETSAGAVEVRIRLGTWRTRRGTRSRVTAQRTGYQHEGLGYQHEGLGCQHGGLDARSFRRLRKPHRRRLGLQDGIPWTRSGWMDGSAADQAVNHFFSRKSHHHSSINHWHFRICRCPEKSTKQEALAVHGGRCITYQVGVVLLVGTE